MRRHFTEDKFIALFLVNAKKNKERQSGSGEVKRIAGTTTQPALALLTPGEGADGNCTTVLHTNHPLLLCLIVQKTRPTD